MLVISREPGTSIHIGFPDGACLITVLKVLHQSQTAALLINRTSSLWPGELDCNVVELGLAGPLKIGAAEVTLVDWREDKVRIGITAPMDTTVHRLEVYQAIQDDRRDSDPPGDVAGSRIPRAPAPKAPSTDVRLDPPSN